MHESFVLLPHISGTLLFWHLKKPDPCREVISLIVIGKREFLYLYIWEGTTESLTFYLYYLPWNLWVWFCGYIAWNFKLNLLLLLLCIVFFSSNFRNIFVFLHGPLFKVCLLCITYVRGQIQCSSPFKSSPTYWEIPDQEDIIMCLCCLVRINVRKKNSFFYVFEWIWRSQVMLCDWSLKFVSPWLKINFLFCS